MAQRVRRQFIVNPRVQYKLLFLTLLSIIIPTLLTFLTLFFIIQSILVDAKIANEMVYNALLFMSHKVFLTLFAGFVTITVLLLLWISLFIHRIVGPLYRLDKELEKAIQGQKIAKIRFRKNDCYSSIADKINVLLDRLPAQETNTESKLS